MRSAVLLAAVLLLSALGSAQESCSAEIQDSGLGVHVVVESCSNIGTYSVGGIYDGRWEKLTFQYPRPWKGTYATLKIDDKYYCTSENARDCVQMDNYTTQKPRVSGNTVESSWQLPNVGVRQSFRIVENKTLISYTVRNTDSANHTVGVRMHIDTMLGVNDGAPIYLPGYGLKTAEVEYSGGSLNFGYWKAYNTPDKPTIVSTGTIDPKSGMTLPVKVIIADWKRSQGTAWDYRPQSLNITGDSAVLMYYDLGVIEPGLEKSAVMAYGSEAPILAQEQGKMGVTEVVLDQITGEYCPQEDARVKVDVLNTGEDALGSVRLVVEKAGKTYYDRKVTSLFQRGQVKTLEFIWTLPEPNETDRFDVRAMLYNSTGLVGSKEKADAIRINRVKCLTPALKVGANIVGGFLLIAAVVSFSLLTATLAYLWYNRGTVDYTKYLDGEYVKVTVTNNTRKTLRDVVIEDTITAEAEIRVLTLNVLRRQNTLFWQVGDLGPLENATLDYWVRGGRAISQSQLRWAKGSKRLK